MKNGNVSMGRSWVVAVSLKKAEFSVCVAAGLGLCSTSTSDGPVAQLDRALPSEGRGHEFESRRVRHEFKGLAVSAAKPFSFWFAVSHVPGGSGFHLEHGIYSRPADQPNRFSLELFRQPAPIPGTFAKTPGRLVQRKRPFTFSGQFNRDMPTSTEVNPRLKIGFRGGRHRSIITCADNQSAGNDTQRLLLYSTVTDFAKFRG